ncbi:hypothetical protein KTO58_19840 [Chitinophaga pendula]|uniref:hypothetical protein n=1 Tax=Chitinophaga TaxID=79328 RepID=UPI0012FE78EC|nr:MULTISPECIES: hypothetical protein [Chitinophaga]UCJ05923.1 hypothetical protein KTO58_19840 [Chitinophaga pendula]
MNLSFKSQFVEPILTGKKIHTIRGVKSENRWMPEKRIHFCTGMRTKKYKCFHLGSCSGLQSIFMTYLRGCIEISVDERYLYRNEIDQLIVNDGLTYDEFIAWFFKDTDEFSGYIIHWTDFRY